MCPKTHEILMLGYFAGLTTTIMVTIILYLIMKAFKK